MIRTLQSLTFLIILILFPANSLFAQESSCAVRLKEAQEKYNSGHIELVPGLLHNCLQSGFTSEEKIQAYKLLINAYIFDNNVTRADNYMLEFLKKYPEYQIVDTDPLEFVHLLNQFNNNPRGSIGLNVGGNLSFIRILEPFSVTGIDSENGKYVNSFPGFHAGVFYNLNLSRRFEISFEPLFVQNTFTYVSEPYTFTRIENIETQGRIDLPLTAIILFPDKKVDYYLRSGLKGSYLLYGKNDIVRSYQNTGGEVFDEVSGPSINFDGEREIFNVSAVLGAGLRYKIPQAYFFLDVRYNLGLLNQVNNASRNTGAEERIWLYYVNQNSFVLDELSLTFGIAKTLYNPKRK
jgi:hypothetical protein